MRPTTKDLAKHLGISRSTVDRVLNGRPGVKDATVKAVQQAIEEIGFQRNLSAANLSKQRIYRFAFLLPKTSGDFLLEIQTQIALLAKALLTENVEIRIQRILETDQHKSAAALAKFSTENTDGLAILAPDSPQMRDALRRTADRGVHVVRIVSGRATAETADFIGIDNLAAGKTAGRLLGGFCKATKGQIAVVTETVVSNDIAARRVGFDEVMQQKLLNLRVLPTLETRGDPNRTAEVLGAVFENYPGTVGVYIMGSEASHALKALDALKRFGSVTVIAHERTPLSLAYLDSGKLDALIVQDPGHLVRSAVRILRARSDARPVIAAQEQIRIEILLQENLVHQHAARDSGA